MSQKQIGMDQIYGPGKDNKAVLKPENIFSPMKETEQTLLNRIKDEVAKIYGYPSYRDFINGMDDSQAISVIAIRYASELSSLAVKEYKEKLEKELILLDAGAAASDYSALHAIRHIRKLIDSL